MFHSVGSPVLQAGRAVPWTSKTSRPKLKIARRLRSTFSGGPISTQRRRVHGETQSRRVEHHAKQTRNGLPTSASLRDLRVSALNSTRRGKRASRSLAALPRCAFCASLWLPQLPFLGSLDGAPACNRPSRPGQLPRLPGCRQHRLPEADDPKRSSSTAENAKDAKHSRPLDKAERSPVGWRLASCQVPFLALFVLFVVSQLAFLA